MSLDPEPPPLTPDPAAALAADASAAHATDPHAGGHGHHGPFHTHCENCGTKLEGPWCHRCGQHDFEFHRSFRHVFMEALESFFHFDGTFFRSTLTLLFKPGRLTAQFNAGKRVSQMPPFRLYVFVAFVFFLIMHFGAHPEEAVKLDGKSKGGLRTNIENDPATASQVVGEVLRELADDGKAAARKIDERMKAAAPHGETLTPEQKAAILRDVTTGPAGEAPPKDQAPPAPAASPDKLTVDAGDNPKLQAWLNQMAERATDKEQRRIMSEKFFAAIPKVLLVCLPLFALFTRLLFRKAQDVVYLKHLVLALHFHTFIYLWLLFSRGAEWLVGLPGWGLQGWVAFASSLWLMVYPFLMLRRLFGNGWLKTIVKTMLLAVMHLTVLSLAIAATAFLIFAL